MHFLISLNHLEVLRCSLEDMESYGLQLCWSENDSFICKTSIDQDGVSVNGKDTMRALEPFYQRNMGQRTGLSFGDIKIINLAYCESTLH